jgi:hypothetical protein
MQREEDVKTQEKKAGHLQAQERGLRRNQPRLYLYLGLLASCTMIHLYNLKVTQVVALCHGSPSKHTSSIPSVSMGWEGSWKLPFSLFELNSMLPGAGSREGRGSQYTGLWDAPGTCPALPDLRVLIQCPGDL